MLFFLSCAWAAAAAWLVARAVGQRSLLQHVAPVASPAFDQLPSVSVIVPARDEAGNIGSCLQALTRQDYPASRLRIIVVDDHSGDTTAAIVRSIAREDSRVALIRSPPLPSRWIGKSHACWIGAQRAGPDSEWLCFIDADVNAAPTLIASAIVAAQAERIDLLSLAPRQELVSFAERLVLPCGLYLLAFRQNLGQVQARDTPDATATGQFMLVRREAYKAAGGHAAICEAICEDVALARLLKRAGCKVVLKSGDRLASARMYRGWRTLWPGVAKNLIDMLGGPVATVTTVLIGVALAWAAVLLPLADMIGCSWHTGGACFALAPALLGAATAIGLHLAGAIHFRIPFWYGFLFPLGYTAGALMALDSLRQRLTGRVRWKGRTYP
ncbi:MAG: glycosyltransferase [Methylocella sp.]